MTRPNTILAFGGTDLDPWGDPLFRAQAPGAAVLVSCGVVEYGGAELVSKLRSAGLERLKRVGREARAVTAGTRAEFDADDAVNALHDAGFLYLQGGNPRLFVEVLGGSRFWATILQSGLPIVTTSGGAMALGARCPDIAPGRAAWVDGLALVPDTLLAPHWDSFHQRDPNFRSGFQREAGPRRLFTIEDRAALQLEGEQLHAFGDATVQLFETGELRTIAPSPLPT